MDKKMFCFQCEQTAGCTGCMGNAGVCGKTAETANLQDELTGALIGLASACTTNPKTEQTDRLLIEGLFTTVTNVNFNDETLREMIRRVREEKERVVPGCASCAARCGSTDDYDMKKINEFFYRALFVLAQDWDTEQLLPVVMETGKVNLTCMELLDRANTETYGTPVPVTVPLKVEKGPFIVITGHDLKDLKLLLEQTEGKGINIYTHGEMLPAHAYPELKKYPHLKGNYGTAWQNQQKEFADLPAPILFTTNCLMPVKESYADRVFTTEVVSYPGTVLSVADKIIDAVKSGEIRHFFLVGGCDGARAGRNYYTEFVKNTPKDTVVLTLACGKYRFNDLQLGTIAGLPRILDMGQCNDAYSAIKTAVALAEAFDCSVNELPLSMVLSWYEQKAVCILLTLLHLGIENIRLGPTLPAFLSQNVLNLLVEKYHIAPITTPEEDLKALLKE